MRTLKYLFVLFLVCGIQSCKKKTSNSNSYNNNSDSYYYEEDEEPYPDDTYCSDVEYYNTMKWLKYTFQVAG